MSPEHRNMNHTPKYIRDILRQQLIEKKRYRKAAQEGVFLRETTVGWEVMM
jgi:hypothetical protein